MPSGNYLRYSYTDRYPSLCPIMISCNPRAINHYSVRCVGRGAKVVASQTPSNVRNARGARRVVFLPVTRRVCRLGYRRAPRRTSTTDRYLAKTSLSGTVLETAPEMIIPEDKIIQCIGKTRVALPSSIVMHLTPLPNEMHAAQFDDCFSWYHLTLMLFVHVIRIFVLVFLQVAFVILSC